MSINGNILEYPFDSEQILQKKRSIRRLLLSEGNGDRLKKKIAVLAGSTVNDIIDILELFLLNYGIEPEFYYSEYGKYWEDVLFDNEELISFDPDIVYIHTSNRNILAYPTVRDGVERVDDMLNEEYERFEVMWNAIANKFGCPIIQNDFEHPYYRLLGNSDAYDLHGRQCFINRLNEKFYDYARRTDKFYIQSINYLASDYGLSKWADPFYWHMYKYAVAIPAIPELAYNLANIIKSIYGRNKKALVLDLDNTLWGGIVGDDGPENIEIGKETPTAEVYSEFQTYVKSLKDLGIVLNIDSKNDHENAIAGLSRPDSILSPDDFLVIKANWDPKDRNLVEIADEMNISSDGMVFVDDNPAERHIVKSNVPGVAVPDIDEPESYLRVLDRSGYFEITDLSEDDLNRNSMYKANANRSKEMSMFTDYSEYLRSLDMKAEIQSFSKMYMARIAQLTNKSNQFNLTTLRCTQADVEKYSNDDSYITLYGKLEDKFGDNGVVAVTFGHIEENDTFHIDLWLMSCRVLKRDMEYAMLDALVSKCMGRGVKEIYGYYYPTSKNSMVKDLYHDFGFEEVSDDDGNTVWKLSIDTGYEKKNRYIEVDYE